MITIPLTSLEVILPTRGMFDTLEIWIYLSEGHKQRKLRAERKSLEQKNRKLRVYFFTETCVSPKKGYTRVVHVLYVLFIKLRRNFI